MKFSKIGSKDYLIIVGIGDTSFKTDDKAVDGVMLFLTKSQMTKAFPLYWKAKTIYRVCKRSKDAETFNMSTMVEDAVHAVRQIEILIFGDYQR